MEDKKTCPKCEGEMEEGFIVDTWGRVGHGSSKQEWGNDRNFIGQLKTKKQIATYRCTSCGFLESYAN